MWPDQCGGVSGGTSSSGVGHSDHTQCFHSFNHGTLEVLSFDPLGCSCLSGNLNKEDKREITASTKVKL